MTGGRKMRIGVLTQYFPPEFAAPSVRISELGRRWQEDGHDVSILTAFPNYPYRRVFDGYRRELLRRERFDGFEVTRTLIVPSRGLGKLANLSMQVSFAVSSGLALILGLPSRPDVWIATSPPLFVGLTGVLARLRHRVPLVVEVRDLWPDYFVELGLLREGLALGLLRRLECWIYRRADLVLTVTGYARERILEKGIPPQKVVFIPTGAEIPERRPLDEAVRVARRRRIGLEPDAFVVVYVGTHGWGQRLPSLAPAVRRLESEGVQFLLVGEGAEKEALRRSLEGTNAVLLPGCPREEVAGYYAIADASLVPLADLPLISRALPSKLFEVMAFGRPVLGLLRGEGAAILGCARAGGVADPEDVEGLVERVRRLQKATAEEREEMGERGRALVRDHYSRKEMACRYAEVLQRLVQEART